MAIVKRMNKGFTLIEIMVVLFIIAVLLAIAVPSYREYLVRARMVEVMKILETHLNAAKSQYLAGGVTPTSVLGINNQVYTAYTNSPYIDYIYYDDGSTWTNTGAAMVQAVISSQIGNGISGFVAGTGGENNTLTMAFLASGEMMHTFCGSWVDDGTQVPPQYLPKGCTDDNFSSEVTG